MRNGSKTTKNPGTQLKETFIHSFICFFNIATDNTQWTYNK